MLNTMCRKNLSFAQYVEMRFIEDACLKTRSMVSCTIAMLQPMVATLDWIKWLRKYSMQASISSCSLRMEGNLPWLAIDVSEQGTFPRGMRCLKVACLRYGYLMYGTLTSWVLFVLPITTFTSLWPLTMFLSRWKLLPPQQMIPRLSLSFLRKIFS